VKTKLLLSACLFVLIALAASSQTVFAHETITVGDYEIEVGWLNEPPIVGEKNAIVIHVFDTGGSPVEDVASLTVTLSYGGQRKILTLQPLGEDTPGQYMAPILPTVPGEYEVIFGGILGDIAVEAETHVEEVQPVDTLEFPSVDASASASGGAPAWLVWLSLGVGLLGVGLGVTALRKAR
jgi:hypothetical protein